jgi:D-glutamate cyclase
LKKSPVQLSGTIESIIQQDPGNRGLDNWAIKDQLLPAASSLSTASDCLLFTSFFIPTAGAIETDGPPGTVVLAQTLISLGKKVTILTDSHAEEVLRAGLNAAGCRADLLPFPPSDAIGHLDIAASRVTHCIAIERPGPASDGFHHNFKGDIISRYIAPLDQVFMRCQANGSTTIGIGDGGNELGMGNVAQALDAFLSPHRPYACVVPSDFCICAGVSNWGAYGLAALLSILTGTNFLLDPGALPCVLDEIVKAGAVDGITGQPVATVDNLPRTWEDEIYEALYRMVDEQLI